MNLIQSSTVGALALLGALASPASCGGRVDLDTVQLPAPSPSSPATAGADGAVPVGATFLVGSFKGHSIAVNDALAILSSTGSQTELAVAYTDGTDICSRLMKNQQEPYTHYLSVVILADSLGGAPPAIGPGTYPVMFSPAVQPGGSTLFASGGYSSLDASCQNDEVMNVAEAGTITLTEVGSRVAGSFSFTFTTGDAFHGSFDVPVCAVAAPGSTRAACLP